MLNLDEEDLPKSSLSVILIGTASNNPEIGSDKVTLDLNAREYIDSQNNSSLLFNLYHFPDTHLLPITKVSYRSSLYITGYLTLIKGLLLIRLTQINFIENTFSLSYKSSNILSGLKLLLLFFPLIKGTLISFTNLALFSTSIKDEGKSC